MGHFKNAFLPYVILKETAFLGESCKNHQKHPPNRFKTDQHRSEWTQNTFLGPNCGLGGCKMSKFCYFCYGCFSYQLMLAFSMAFVTLAKHREGQTQGPLGSEGVGILYLSLAA